MVERKEMNAKCGVVRMVVKMIAAAVVAVQVAKVCAHLGQFWIPGPSIDSCNYGNCATVSRVLL